MKTKNTKRSLIISTFSLIICVAMLVGTTFAWFTDSVASSGNKIKSGTLDVKLLMHDGNDYVDISDSGKPIFGEGSIAQNNAAETLWEPGKTQIVYLAIQNAGSLALKYNILIDVTDNGLADSLKYAIIDDVTKDEAAAYNVNSWADILAVDGIQTGNIVSGRMIGADNGAVEPEAYDYFALAVHMDEQAGNEFMDKDVSINIEVLATQHTYEEDSFDNQYDAAAKDTIVYTQDALNSALEANKSLVLLAPGEYTLSEDYTYQNISIVGMDGAKITSADYTNWENVTIENVAFTFAIKENFKGDSMLKNCTFDIESGNAIRNSKVTSGATLTIENCTFNLPDMNSAIHFSGNENGTVVMKDCTVNQGYLSFGKTMNVNISNCDFNDYVAISCYGDVTVTDSSFTPDCEVYVHKSTKLDAVVTMNGCTVDNGAEVSSVCYDKGAMTNWKIIIDGTEYTAAEL